MGGEKLAIASTLFLLLGSPPRGRGKASHCFHTLSIAGITPAWAGKSPVWHPCSGRCGDHPRVGGEKDRLSQHFKAEEGSPPRGRGKAQADAKKKAEEGITPAWAGKSASTAHPAASAVDHPRVGGEKRVGLFKLIRILGSPPRGRGKVLHLFQRISGEGITPAWAGKSPCSRPARCPNGDHPRVGGEKPFRALPGMEQQGSPPRGRGKVNRLL